MSVPSASERSLLNTHPQQSKLYLSVFRPSIALICQVNGSYDATDQSVSYDGVTSGSYTNIIDYFYQVALIGSSEGGDEYGRTWVRSATSNTIRFVESDHINWQDNAYITVLKYTEIIPVFPRIIQNPADDEDVIFYKVWDIAYTNQNSILGTFISMGSNYAGFLTTGSTQVYWSASGTSNVLGDTVTHSWIFEGATITGSNAHTPGNVVYTTPGHYRTIYSSTSSSGRVDRSIRYVSIYDRPGFGPRTPIMNFELIEFGGSRDGVGYSGRIRVRDLFTEDSPTTADAYIDGALVVIFKEDWYGNTNQSISKNAKGRENIFFVGYINGGTVQFDYVDNSVEFEVLSPTNLMEITECFSVSVESKPTPTVWYELLNMDVRRAVYHYLAWHSSVLLCCDFEAKNLNDRNIQYFDADRTSLYDAVNSVVNGALRGRIISDSLGKIWAERDVSVINGAGAVLDVAATLSKADWLEPPHIEERQMMTTAFIELGGIAYNPVTGQSTALLASAPGSAPGYRGKPERSQGFALQDQDELNTLVGDMFAHMNSRYPTVDLRLRGNYANFDIAPQEIARLNIARSDTPRGITFSNKAFAVRGVNYIWDSRTEVLLTSLQLAEITQGFGGTSIAIPIEPPDVDDNNGGSVNQPPIQVPPIPQIGVGGSGSAVNVYENGVFKMTTNGLNFIGSIVRVFANTAESRADIYFDACGCSGSFYNGASTLAGTVNFGRTADTNPSGTPNQHPDHTIDDTTWTMNDYHPVIFNSLSDITDNGGYYKGVSGSATITAPFTGMYSVRATFNLSNVIYQRAPGNYQLNYNLTAHVGGVSETATGSYDSTGQPVGLIVAIQDVEDPSIYLQAGEALNLYVDGTITEISNNIYPGAQLAWNVEITVQRAT